jgi:hypothetical protein
MQSQCNMDYYQYFKDSKGNRDTVFQDVLERFNKKSIAILEVGCARNLSKGSRQGDGWSSFHFLEYVSEHGHILDICDIDQEALVNCQLLLKTFPRKYAIESHELGFHRCTGVSAMFIDYDLFYLDGGDDPNEMVEEYEEILKLKEKLKHPDNNYNPLVLCDDFHAKGSLLRKKYPEFLLYKWENNDHEMALFGAESGVKLLQPIQ